MAMSACATRRTEYALSAARSRGASIRIDFALSGTLRSYSGKQRRWDESAPESYVAPRKRRLGLSGNASPLNGNVSLLSNGRLTLNGEKPNGPFYSNPTNRRLTNGQLVGGAKQLTQNTCRPRTNETARRAQRIANVAAGMLVRKSSVLTTIIRNRTWRCHTSPDGFAAGFVIPATAASVRSAICPTVLRPRSNISKLTTVTSLSRGTNPSGNFAEK